MIIKISYKNEFSNNFSTYSYIHLCVPHGFNKWNIEYNTFKPKRICF